jgi:hypothetical protein
MLAADIKPRIMGRIVAACGYAAKPIANLLMKKGGTLAMELEGFAVMDSEGPLKEGEIGRAKEWAGRILSAV